MSASRLTTAVVAFAGTTIDDVIILIALFMTAAPPADRVRARSAYSS